MPAGSLAKAEDWLARTRVNGPGPDSVSTSPAGFDRGDQRHVVISELTAFCTILRDGYIAAPYHHRSFRRAGAGLARPRTMLSASIDRPRPTDMFRLHALVTRYSLQVGCAHAYERWRYAHPLLSVAANRPSRFLVRDDVERADADA